MSVRGLPGRRARWPARREHHNQREKHLPVPRPQQLPETSKIRGKHDHFILAHWKAAEAARRTPPPPEPPRPLEPIGHTHASEAAPAARAERKAGKRGLPSGAGNLLPGPMAAALQRSDSGSPTVQGAGPATGLHWRSYCSGTANSSSTTRKNPSAKEPVSRSSLSADSNADSLHQRTDSHAPTRLPPEAGAAETSVNPTDAQRNLDMTMEPA